jgi:hypothetical protein
MNSMIKRIWKEPVGSSVISSIIIGILTLIGIKVKSNYDDKSFNETFNWTIDYQVKLSYVIGIIILLLIIRAIFKSKNDYYNRKQRKLRKFNYTVDPDLGIRSEWGVYFGDYGKPFIADLEFYCTEHGEAPIRFNHNCNIKECKNSRINLDEYKVKNHLESLVINEWNKIK